MRGPILAYDWTVSVDLMAQQDERRKKATQAKRAAILNAARCLFAHKGFSETNVNDIAAEAGIAKGTIYLYFPSKEQIYMAALLEDARRLDSVTRERMEAVTWWRDKIEAYVRVRLEYLESRTAFFRIYLAEIRSMLLRGLPVHPDFFQVVRESEGLLGQTIAAAAARGDIREVDPELAASAVVDLTRGLMERRLINGGTTEDRDVRFALELLCHSLSRTSQP